MSELSYINEYYDNNGQKLRGMVNKILFKYGGLTNKDFDDFYSLANEVFASIIKTYDKTKNFSSYFKVCLENKIKTEITNRNRIKRTSNKEAISIDTPIGEGNITIADTLVSDFDIENEIEMGNYSEGFLNYYNTLSTKQKEIIKLCDEGYEFQEIRNKLNMTERIFNDNLEDMKSFDKFRVLKQNNILNNTSNTITHTDKINDKEILQMNINTHTVEKSKNKSYSISSIIKQMENYTIRFDHPAQRESEQWTSKMKSNLISDVLQDNPIPALVFAEQIIDGMSIVWDLDGKQRCTNVYSYRQDKYKISRQVSRPIITYKSIKKDDNGNIQLTENGIPQFEWVDFDIRNKKYSQLPEELQDKFNDYTFEVTQYINCTSNDIIYHIGRYNEGKPMNVSQKGFIQVGEEFAVKVKEIANMPFFKEKGDYSIRDFRNGTINRVIIETIMASNFLDNWKNQEEMCKYIRENGSIEIFESLESDIDTLNDIVTEEVSDLFNSKDSFIWFTLFDKFKMMSLENKKYIEFLIELKNNLHCMKINGMSFDMVNEDRSTKNKKLIEEKLNILEKLMEIYINGENNNEICDETNIDTLCYA